MYQPLWLCCWRGDISSFSGLLINLQMSSVFFLLSQSSLQFNNRPTPVSHIIPITIYTDTPIGTTIAYPKNDKP